MAYVASVVGDSSILASCLVVAGSVAGFLVWNFPSGRIFLGDGGAYFLGFMIAELSVLLVQRHPLDVSPWFPLLLVAYPAWETIFSFYRKVLLRGRSATQPDGLHFHMMVYKRVVRWKVGSKDPADMRIRNSLTSPYLWMLSLVAIVPAAVFWDNSVALAFLAFGFGFFYNWLFNRMATFRVPKGLIVYRPAADSRSGAGARPRYPLFPIRHVPAATNLAGGIAHGAHCSRVRRVVCNAAYLNWGAFKNPKEPACPLETVHGRRAFAMYSDEALAAHGGPIARNLQWVRSQLGRAAQRGLFVPADCRQ